MTVPARRPGLLKRFGRLFLVPLPGRQGVHVDPIHEPAPDASTWHADHTAAMNSREMEVFRDALRLDSFDVREAVLNDLATYYKQTPEQALDNCLRWEEWSRAEWSAADRSTREGLEGFYQTVQSWSFDLLWYAYLQCAGHGFPASVAAACFAHENCQGRDHLDFGSGVGVTAQLFSRLGYATSMADISRALLDFSKWRLARRGDHIEQVHLVSTPLESGAYDLITAIDTLVHVPDVKATVRALHRALRPGGWLLANFDVRDPDAIQWHLHDDIARLEHDLLEAGFILRRRLADVTYCYQRVDLDDPEMRTRIVRARLLLPLARFRVLARRLRGRRLLRRWRRALFQGGRT